jgi:serine/threonine protein kinase
MTSEVLQQEPRWIGPYEVLGCVGRGATGAVYKARHALTGSLVAVKVLAAEAADNPVSLRRFEREFRTAQGLDHPHIVRGLDFGREGTQPYLVLELVDGPSLGTHLRTHGRLDEAEALAIIEQVGQALHAAHEQGLIHRDVKPDNVILGTDGRARLTDFGLVKDVALRVTMTAHAAALGTPYFMAPEQFEDARAVDRRCDVYGLGATLYMAVTGEIPFKGRGYMDTVRRKLARELVSPRQLVPALSPRTEQAILRALNERPTQRPASCLDFLVELRGEDGGSGANVSNGLLRVKAAAAPAWTGPERRASVRRACRRGSLCLPLGSEGQTPWEAEVRNISAGGLGLVLGRRVEPGTVLLVEWQQAVRGAPTTLLARVIHAQPLPTGRWRLGCQLTQGLGEDEIQALL